ncbi:EamA family transporter [Candidatus Roizmanbacteria bacterium]|nr:MAG: EamA family transporter [Candidatus Roizmanbacteria bacterium]
MTPIYFLIIDFTRYNPYLFPDLLCQQLLDLHFLATFGTVGFFYFYIKNLFQKGGPMYASLSFYLNPIAASIFGSIFLHERLTPFILLGASVTFLGVWIYGRK